MKITHKFKIIYFERISNLPALKRIGIRIGNEIGSKHSIRLFRNNLPQIEDI